MGGKILLTAALFLVIVSYLATVAQEPRSAAAASFHWGVNGHPNVQVGYIHVPLQQQLDLVRQLGAKWYRCDWDEGRWRRQNKDIDRLVELAEKRGIHILPVIFPATSFRSDATPEQIRAASFTFAKNIAAHFRGRIPYWELDNEMETTVMIRKGERDRHGKVWPYGTPAGDHPDRYEQSRYQKAKAELIGLHAGIKAGDPNAKTIVDCAGWLHYGFFERLVNEDKVPFDVLGWHWYSEMGDMTKVRGTINVLEKLRSYGKPIWITEINYRARARADDAPKQAAYLEAAAKRIHGYAGVDAFFVYELLDEPYFGNDNPESHYGLVTLLKSDDGRWRVGTKKPAFQSVRTVIESLKGEPR